MALFAGKVFAIHTSMFDTRNDLSLDARTSAVSIMNRLLAELTDLHSQTKTAHWNVRGHSFYTLHKLFDELAEAIHGHLDPLAERITALGGFAMGTVRNAAQASELEEFPSKQAGEFGYVEALAERFAQTGTAVRKGIDDTDELGDADTADLLTAISRDLDKGLWFLEAHTSQ